MECVRIGILHHRSELRVVLPPGTVLESSAGSRLLDGAWSITPRLLEAGSIWTGIKVLECGDEELLDRARERLVAAGLDVLDSPHAPGRSFGNNLCTMGTRLLLVPITGLNGTIGLDHVSREGARKVDLPQLERVREALGPLRGQPSTCGPPALWHTEAAQRHQVTAWPAEGHLVLKGPRDEELVLRDGVRIHLPDSESALVDDVRVGIGFHWDHQEALAYNGTLECRFESSGLLCLINELDIEDYLASVNSSEMTADSPADLLRAQTVAARSTLLATSGRHHADEPFDICADDHCQCFRGTGVIQEESRQAVAETAGQVLSWEGAICDARYSKSCGGITEAYEHVWENQSVPYMVSLRDTLEPSDLPRPGSEHEWQAWILADEDVCCNTERHAPPASLAACEGLYRWTVRTTRSEVAAQIRATTGAEFDLLFDLSAVSRGDSGRIEQLNVTTDRGSFMIGKELVIRRALWKNCLYSSAIFFEWDDEALLIHGKGWGHGVGLCQLGALHMAREGRNWTEILAHYYPGSRLCRVQARDTRTSHA